MPFTSDKLFDMLNIEGHTNWTSKSSISENQTINKAQLLFKKIEDEEIDSQIEKLKANAPKASKHKPMKDTISFEDFTKLDIRVATILDAKKHENADKLLVLKVDTGLDQRTIVSGIAAHYSPEDIVGKKVSVLLNLAPRKIRGIESQGMILMAENTDESELAFVSPEKEIENGGEVR